MLVKPQSVGRRYLNDSVKSDVRKTLERRSLGLAAHHHCVVLLRMGSQGCEIFSVESNIVWSRMEPNGATRRIVLGFCRRRRSCTLIPVPLFLRLGGRQYEPLAHLRSHQWRGTIPKRPHHFLSKLA